MAYPTSLCFLFNFNHNLLLGSIVEKFNTNHSWPWIIWHGEIHENQINIDPYNDPSAVKAEYKSIFFKICNFE